MYNLTANYQSDWNHQDAESWIRAESCPAGKMWGVWAACVKFQMIDSNMLCALRRSPWFLPWGRNVLSPPRSWPANREMDFAAQATSTTHNQSLAFSLVLSPKRRPSQTTSIILLWFLIIDLLFSPLLVSLFHCCWECSTAVHCVVLCLITEVLFGNNLLYIKQLQK